MISQSDRMVVLLEGMIERGELAPGSMISERGLMEMTGFGRTPVREAIQRLALSHMLRIHPNRGIEIPAASVEDQLSRLEVRRVTEVLAVTLACERASPEDLGDMRDMMAVLEGEFSLQGYSETVRQTHRLVTRAACNPYLEALMPPLQALSRRFWIMHVRDDAREIGHGKSLHRQMLAAIADRNVERSREASLALNDYLVQFALDVVSQRARVRA